MDRRACFPPLPRKVHSRGRQLTPLLGGLGMFLAISGPAFALVATEIPTHSHIIRTDCVRPKDFCLIKAGGYWHLYAIKHDTRLLEGASTNSFMHQRSLGNFQSWEVLSDEALNSPARTTTDWNKDHIWAPHIVERSGVYHMFYTGVKDSGGVAVQRMGVTTATNLNPSPSASPWNPSSTDPTSPVFISPTSPWNVSSGDFRDPFVMPNPNGSNWLMYYVARKSDNTMGIGVATSGTSGDPLLGPWSNGGEIVSSPTQYDSDKPIESPTLFHHGSTWYALYTGGCSSSEAVPACDDTAKQEVRLMTSTSSTLDPSAWQARGRLSNMLDHDASYWYAPEYVKDPDTGEEFLAVVRQSQENSTTCRPPAETDSSNIELRRIVWDVDTSNPWKFQLVDPNPPGYWTSQTPSTGPSGRSQVGAAIETKRQSIYAFGGTASGTVTNEIWSFPIVDRPVWTNRTPSGGTPPSARRHAGVVYDPVGDRLVVFGGFTGSALSTLLADTWTFGPLAGTPAWSSLSLSGSPSGFSEGSEAVYDAARTRMIVVDGAGNAWALALPSSGSPSWSQLNSSGGLSNAGGYYFSLVLDSRHDRLLAFGGYDPNRSGSTSMNAVYAFPLSGTGANAWHAITTTGSPPSARALAAAVYDPGRDRLLIRGGMDVATGVGSAKSDGWQLSYGTTAYTGTWTQLSSVNTGPTARAGVAAAYDALEDRALLLGGQVVTGSDSTQAWSWSLGDGAPWRVTDLTANVRCKAVDLTWTSPRDFKSNPSDDPADASTNPVSGSATGFEVQWSTSPITPTNPGTNLFATFSLMPIYTAGSTVTTTVTYPDCAPNGYYAVFLTDETGRESRISNSSILTHCPGPNCFDEAPDRVQAMDLTVSSGNPARGPVTLQFAVPASGNGQRFDLALFDVAGRQLKRIAEGLAAPGRHALTIPWTGQGGETLSRGVYFLRFRLGDRLVTRSIVAMP